MTAPPAPGRSYWICQAAGWGGFLAYVLGGYLLTDHPRTATDIVSIVFFNAVVGPAAAHGLRHWMYVRGWHQMSGRRRFPRLVAAVAGLASGLTAAVVLALVLAGQPMMSAGSAFSIAAGFAMAFTGWLTIYFAVQTRRHRDAIQLELAVVARDAQLRSLRAQLNPHFLFNCLNSLRHLIVTEPARAEIMVTGLAELLRYSLASDRTDSVALGDELRVVDEYLDLERVRLEDRLTVERAVAPDALHARVPPMLIQTLVDNAIRHGIAELPGGGIVRIEARRANGRVEILVTNTGQLKPPKPDGGHGLENTKERLRLIYGDAATFSLRQTRGTVEARLALPMEPA
jgi:two-component system LytT family sensor kinase